MYSTLPLVKGQFIPKVNCQAVNSSKKRTNEFVFTMRRVFVCFLEEIEDTKKTFQNNLTFSHICNFFIGFAFTVAKATHSVGIGCGHNIMYKVVLGSKIFFLYQ